MTAFAAGMRTQIEDWSVDMDGPASEQEPTGAGRPTAQSVLSEARDEAESIIAAARAAAATLLDNARSEAEALRDDARSEAEAMRERTLFAARQDAEEIVDRALVHRELLLSATLERIATLSGSLISMAERIVAHAEDPATARAELAHFMLVLTGMADEVAAEDPEG